MHQEYNEYLQKKNSNNRNAKANGKSKKEEFFATLPLKGMDSAKVIFIFFIFYFSIKILKSFMNSIRNILFNLT